MICTINTDASFHPKLKWGAYAFWAVSDRFKIQKYGGFRGKCLNPTDAETKCIINALQVVLAADKDIKRIIINTDSLNAISIIENHRDNIHRYSLHFGSHLRRKFKKILNKYPTNPVVEFRHVKAHSNVGDARGYVNEWCDKNAKRKMWSKVNRLNKQKTKT